MTRRLGSPATRVRVPTLLLTGPVGVGKTTVALEASEMLGKRGVHHAVIDLDALSWCYPPPLDDRFRNRLVLRNLRDIWPNYETAGAGREILARVIETREAAAEIAAAIPDAELQVVRLRASSGVLSERVARREAGPGRDRLLARALELAEQQDEAALEDHLVDTDGRPAAAVAAEVLRVSGWLDASTDEAGA